MFDWNLPDLMDHTVLRPDATKIDVLRLCQEPKELRFTVICVPPCYVDEAVAAVAGTAIRVGIPIGFPRVVTRRRSKSPKPLKRPRAARKCWIWS